MSRKKFSLTWKIAVVVLAAILSSDALDARKEQTLFSFNGGDGNNPYSGILVDASGHLYGTTFYGAKRDFGVVFELTPKSGGGWAEKVLADGLVHPEAGLTADAAGHLYGTSRGYCSDEYCNVGFVFEVKHSGNSWKESIIYQFTGSSDGATPEAGLILDGSGNLYGTTTAGGYFGGDCYGTGCGTVFELTPNSGGVWTETVLYSFTGGGEGGAPSTGLTLDASGNLYGTAGGGAYRSGLVFELSPSNGGWTEQVLYSFGQGSDGTNPSANLTLDKAGNIYGTTFFGGGQGTCDIDGSNKFCGTVFELTPNSGGTWTESLLYRFTGGSDGAEPRTQLVFDDSGNLYGATEYGGNPKCQTEIGVGCGTVFELTNLGGNWTERVLHGFDGNDGQFPIGDVAFDNKGNVYGTTGGGGAYKKGVVFEVTP
jgi:uncharacterized repeat protein (TIGR03803 family)